MPMQAGQLVPRVFALSGRGGRIGKEGVDHHHPQKKLFLGGAGLPVPVCFKPIMSTMLVFHYQSCVFFSNNNKTPFLN